LQRTLEPGMQRRMHVAILVALRSELDLGVLPGDVVITGIGKVNAALAAARIIQERQPELIVNYGTAGGVACAPHQLVEVGAVVQRDADIEPLAPRGALLDDVVTIKGAWAGVRCGSGDSFVRGADPWLQANCDIVDMELWGIAKACTAAGVGWRSVKWVTDTADENAAAAWKANVHRGTGAFLDWLTKQGYWSRKRTLR
jgi:adenosylhomocysteine nucleosidase